MSFFKKLFGKNDFDDSRSASEHLVRLHIPLSENSFRDTKELNRLSNLEHILHTAASRAGVGGLDGNEVGGGQYKILLYGANGANLAEVVKTEALKFDLPAGCTLFIRHGSEEDSNAREETLQIN